MPSDEQSRVLFSDINNNKKRLTVGTFTTDCGLTAMLCNTCAIDGWVQVTSTVDGPTLTCFVRGPAKVQQP